METVATYAPEPVSPRSGLRVARRVAGLVGSTAMTFASSMGHANLAPTTRRRAAAWRLHRACRELRELHGVEIERIGAAPRGPVIVVANHLSYLDPIVLGGELPCTAVAKREIEGWPVLGTHLRDLGVMFVDRDDPHSGASVLRQAARALDSGVAVLNFPEGTTTRGDSVLPFRRGIFGVALRLGVPVVPVRLDFEDRNLAWVGDATLVPHYLSTASKKTLRVRVRWGPHLCPDDFPTADSLARLTRFMIQHDLAESPAR